MTGQRKEMKPNQAQRCVIEELDRNVLLLASAGTGKTGTVAQRIGHIIKMKRAEPSQILALTFTNKASKELKESILQVVGPEGQGVWTGTFHSFCFKVLEEEGKAIDSCFEEMTVFDEEESKALVKDIWMKLEGSRLELAVSDIFSYFLAFLKEKKAFLQYFGDDDESEFQRTIDFIMSDYALSRKVKDMFTLKGTFLSGHFIKALERGASLGASYNRELRENRVVDFNDLIGEVYKLFQNDEVRLRWKRRFTYIIIDEVQDTSQLEFEILRHLWPGNHILLSGDFFQTIYEWRGSQPEPIIEAFKRDYNPRIITFYENYRSTKLLLNASVEALEAMVGKGFDAVYKERPRSISDAEGAPIDICEVENIEAEAKVIYEGVKKAEGTKCVLVRDNRQIEELSALLEDLGEKDPSGAVAFIVADDFKFYRRKSIKDAFAFFKFLANPFDKQSGKTIIQYIRGVGPATLAAIESEACRQAGLRLSDFLLLKNYEREPFSCLVEGLKRRDIVVFDVESTGTDTTSDDIIQIAAIRIDEKGRAVDRFERFIRPTKSVGDSEAIHGFSDDFLWVHGEEAPIVLKDFIEFASHSVIVGHNVNYDMSILASELERHGLEALPYKDVYDTLDIYRRFYPNISRYTLGYLSDTFHTRHKPSHNAMDDILATAELLVQVVEERIIPTESERNKYLRLKDSFAEMAAQLATLRDHSYYQYPKDLLAYMMKDFPLGHEYDKQEHEAGKVQLRNLYCILRDMEKDYPTMGPRDMLHRAIQNASMTAKEIPPRILLSGKTPIITVHQAKGSEFDTVFLAGMEDKSFPSFQSYKGDPKGKPSKEEQRLFYVAITRPKKRLIITYKRHKWYRECKESPFLSYLNKAYVRRWRR